MIRLVAATFVAASLLAIPAAIAARPPTLGERAAITRALPLYLRNTPVECVWLVIRVSRNPRYAKVDPVYLVASPGSRCLRYASDGFYVLKKSRKWRIIYSGSDPPLCSKRIPRDLVACLP